MLGSRLLAVEPMLSTCRAGDVWIVIEHVVGDDWTCLNERTGERAVWHLPDAYHFTLVLPRRPAGEVFKEPTR